MQASPQDLAQLRLDNALALFEEFVRATARHADAAALRGLEKRFAEKIQIQPSYWSQIKSRSRQIGERLARQFEQLCHKPAGWMDQRHPTGALATAASAAGLLPVVPAAAATGVAGVAGIAMNSGESLPRDDDERFIVGLVLTYYRRHPQRARGRLLDLLGEVLTPGPVPEPSAAPMVAGRTPPRRSSAGSAPGPLPSTEDARALWLRTQTGVAPLKKK